MVESIPQNKIVLGHFSGDLAMLCFVSLSELLGFAFRTTKRPIDLMRSLGPALNGDFYRVLAVDGSRRWSWLHQNA